MKTAWTFDWTDAAIALLTDLWLAGHSGGEIGRRMGLSRSAVMGKLRRLDLLCRDRPKLPIVRMPRQPEPAPKKPAKSPDRFFAEFTQKPLPPPPPEPPIGRYTILQLKAGQCRWPTGERPDYQFCGQRQASNSSYCLDHAQLSLSRGSQRDYDRAAEQALAGKLFASRAGVME